MATSVKAPLTQRTLAFLLSGALALVTTACGSQSAVDDTPSPDEAGAPDAYVAPPLDATVGHDSAVVVPPPADAGPFDAGPCIPQVLDCTGKCGPITDDCSGMTKQCGGCAPLTVDGGASAPQVCDLTTHTCGAPKITCQDEGAECGTIKNSCGTYIDCAPCAAGNECNHNTHKCQACEQVSCQDLGFECGSAWLGCGDPTTNVTDCGTCAGNAAKPRCNTAYHVCEPACVPKTPAQTCADAKAKNGVQCGNITDGCGGLIDCSSVPTFGCPAGQSCGVRGIANRCDVFETPNECQAAGRNCDPSDPTKQLKSACTGAVLDCGTCTAPEVCNDNGVCGAPCQPKSCAVLGNPACGSFDDGCGGKVPCGGCAAGSTCKANNTCCVKKVCAVDYPNKCGTGLDDGCGGTIDCNTCIATTQTCTDDGVQGGNTGVPPKGTTGACCMKKKCADYGAAACGQKLSDGCGGTIDCGGCTAALCTVSNGAGGQRQTNPGEVGACCVRNTCTTCTDIQDNCAAVGTLIDCAGYACGGGQLCGGVGQNACCTPPAAPNVPADCGTVAGAQKCNITLSNTNTCSTVTAACNCPSGLSCVTTFPGAAPTPVCCKAKTCAVDYVGQCGSNLDDGCGSTLNCNCTAGHMCSSVAAGVAGTCACDAGPYTCASPQFVNKCGTFDNGCGTNIGCGCLAGQACFNQACCTPLVCPVLPAVGTPCGAHNNTCGGTYTCSCPTPPESRFMCTGAAGMGTCQCTPRTAAQCSGRTGVIPDGCGGDINCGG